MLDVELIEELPFPVLITDLKMIVKYINPALEKAFHVKITEVLDMTIEESGIIPKKDLDRTMRHFNDRVRGENVEPYELEVVVPSGERYFCVVHGQLIKNKDVPKYVMFCLSDISKKIELKLNEDIYKTIFENTGAATGIFGKDHVIRKANSRFAKLVDMDISEIEGKKRWFDFVVKKDLKRMFGYHQDRRNRADAPNEYEFDLVDSKGKIKRMLCRVDLIPRTNDSIASLIDITELVKVQRKLRESDKKYKDIFENASDSIFLLDLNGKIMDVNNKVCMQLGYNKSEIIGMDFNNLIRGAGLNYMKQIVRHLKTAPSMIISKTLNSKWNDSVEVQINMKLKGDRILGIARNITEIHELKARIKKLERKQELTENEQIVLSDLASSPMRTDRAIAEKHGIKRSTITAIRNKLINQNYISFNVMPSPVLLDCGILLIAHCTLNHATFEAIHSADIPSEVVFLTASDKDLIMLACDNNYGNLTDMYNRFITSLEKKKILLDSKVWYFPQLKKKFQPHISMANTLRSVFLLPTVQNTFQFNPDPIVLTRKEENLLKAIVQNPCTTDIALQKETGVSRPKISQFKKKMLLEGYIYPFGFPNFIKLGFELFHVNIFKFKNNIEQKQILPVIENPQVCFSMHNARDLVTFSFYENYEEYDKSQTGILNNLDGLLVPKNDLFLMPIIDILYQKMNTSNLVKKKLKKRINT